MSYEEPSLSDGLKSFVQFTLVYQLAQTIANIEQGDLEKYIETEIKEIIPEENSDAVYKYTLWYLLCRQPRMLNINQYHHIEPLVKCEKKQKT